MPYIEQWKRDQLKRGVKAVDTAGELNYMVTRLVREYLETHGLSYATINDIVGALEGAKLEFYRRIAVPYEESKITANGDVYR